MGTQAPQPAAPSAQPPNPPASVPTGGPTSTRRPPSRRSSASCRAAPPGTRLQAPTPVWRVLHPWAQLNRPLIPKSCCDPHFHSLPRRSSPSHWALWAETAWALLRKWLSLSQALTGHLKPSFLGVWKGKGSSALGVERVRPKPRHKVLCLGRGRATGQFGRH